MHIDGFDSSSTYVWGSGGTPNWVDLGDWLDEDLEPGVENIISVRMGEGGEEQDGVEFQGSALFYGATMPAPGTRTWLRVRYTDTDGTSYAKVVGGSKGLRVRVGHSTPRPAGQGKEPKRVEFSSTGGAPGSQIEADQT